MFVYGNPSISYCSAHTTTNSLVHPHIFVQDFYMIDMQIPHHMLTSIFCPVQSDGLFPDASQPFLIANCFFTLCNLNPS